MSILIGCFLIFVCEQSLDLRLALFNVRIVSQGCKNVSKLRLSLLTSYRRTNLQLDIFNVVYIVNRILRIHRKLVIDRYVCCSENLLHSLLTGLHHHCFITEIIMLNIILLVSTLVDDKSSDFININWISERKISKFLYETHSS
jgi:hypothetical protein